MCKIADLNGDGFVNFADLGLFKTLFLNLLFFIVHLNGRSEDHKWPKRPFVMRNLL